MSEKNGLKWKKYFQAREKYMANSIFNNDFRDFLNALNQANVKYVLVGGYSVIFYGYNRVTGDLDLFLD
ncbi:MAG: hypothetical protein IPF52_02935 [Saprospiraceae bacterium]|nr:hypothetical protein [Saprospiraceae bacterium]